MSHKHCKVIPVNDRTTISTTKYDGLGERLQYLSIVQKDEDGEIHLISLFDEELMTLKRVIEEILK
jgi:hypothetical protein